jgi:hypothetical protein
MEKTQRELWTLLSAMGVDPVLVNAAVASEYYFMQVGQTPSVGDAFYGQKMFIGYTPLDDFLTYLRTGESNYRAKHTIHRISSRDHAIEVLSSGRHKKYLTPGL